MDLTQPKLAANRTIAESIEASRGAAFVPVTFEQCDHIEGPFFHGTYRAFDDNELLLPGYPMNHQHGRLANHLYFAALLEPAVWGAELAVARTASEGPGYIYRVEPTGPFEDDPNVTNKKFPGNVTRSYRTRHPMRIVAEVTDWIPHPPEVLQQMLDNLNRLREQGLDIIED